MEKDNISLSGNNENKGEWNPLLRQIRIFFTLWSLYFVYGVFRGTPTVTRPQLIKEANTTAAGSDEMFSWIYSVSSFSGAFFGVILTIIAHKYGRKKTTLLISANMVAASILVYFSWNAVHILISQLILGILLAGCIVTFPLVIAEYSTTKYRGIFLTLISATIFWGLWAANAVGIFSNYRNIGLLSFIISSFSLISACFMPESPYWLASNSKFDECVLAHRLLKGDGDLAEKELNLLITMQKMIIIKETKQSLRKHIIKHFRLLRQAAFVKPIALIFLVFLMYELSGKMVCAIYSIELMKKITQNESKTHITVLVLDGFSVLGMYVGCGLAKVLKRRTMLLINTSVGVAFLLAISLYLYLIKLTILSENVYIITILLVCYSLSICCGPLILSTSIFGELVPMRARSFSACFSCFLFLTVGGIHAKLVPPMFEHLDIHGTFLTYGICSIVCIILVYKFLPETKDKSLYEIHAMFSKEKLEDLNKNIDLLIVRKEQEKTQT